MKTSLAPLVCFHPFLIISSIMVLFKPSASIDDAKLKNQPDIFKPYCAININHITNKKSFNVTISSL